MSVGNFFVLDTVELKRGSRGSAPPSMYLLLLMNASIRQTTVEVGRSQVLGRMGVEKMRLPCSVPSLLLEIGSHSLRSCPKVGKHMYRPIRVRH